MSTIAHLGVISKIFFTFQKSMQKLSYKEAYEKLVKKLHEERTYICKSCLGHTNSLESCKGCSTLCCEFCLISDYTNWDTDSYCVKCGLEALSGIEHNLAMKILQCATDFVLELPKVSCDILFSKKILHN